MAVYRTILVTMDCSAVDEAIVAHVTELARETGAAVRLLHVIHAHSLDQERAGRERAECHLGAHERTMRAAGIDVKVVLRRGEPEQEILAEIAEGDYDLVAMATHGHTFLADAVLGSVSRTLKHRLRIPLLLLRG